MLPDFMKWLTEKSKRTALGIYPPAYGTGQYPPLHFAPISATHVLAFARIHGDEHPELLSKEIRDEFKKHGLKKKKPKDDSKDSKKEKKSEKHKKHKRHKKDTE